MNAVLWGNGFWQLVDMNLCKKTFMLVQEKSVDAKLSQLQAMILQKGEYIVKSSSQILGLLSELKNAEHVVPEAELSASARLPKEYDVTVNSTMSFWHKSNKAVSKLIARETKLRITDHESYLALVTEQCQQDTSGNTTTVESRDILRVTVERRI